MPPVCCDERLLGFCSALLFWRSRFRGLGFTWLFTFDAARPGKPRPDLQFPLELLTLSFSFLLGLEHTILAIQLVHGILAHRCCVRPAALLYGPRNDGSQWIGLLPPLGVGCRIVQRSINRRNDMVTLDIRIQPGIGAAM